MKLISWVHFLTRSGELVASEFSKTVIGKVEVQSQAVTAVKVINGEDLCVYLASTNDYIFRANNTWAWVTSDGNIHLKRDSGEAPGTTFVFRLKAPFIILPSLPAKTEKAALPESVDREATLVEPFSGH